MTFDNKSTSNTDSGSGTAPDADTFQPDDTACLANLSTRFAKNDQGYQRTR